MKIVLLHLDLMLDGCSSLKEKRSRIAPLRALGREAGLAVCEVADHDVLQRSVWSVVALGTDAGQVDRLCRRVEDFVAERVDGRVADIAREAL